MKTETRDDLFSKLHNMEVNGYPELMNYHVIRELLQEPSSTYTQVYDEVIAAKPTMDLVNLSSMMAGVANLLGEREFGAEAAFKKFEDRNFFDTFVAERRNEFLKLAKSRVNNPTIPQRGLVFACNMPDVESIGVLELGCSRGDIGSVLLNCKDVLAKPEDYLFESFSPAVPVEELKKARQIDSYFGVDKNIKLDDEWLLALWGLVDPRRETLKNFYRDFQPINSERFCRHEANAFVQSAWGDEALRFHKDTKHLVIITSFMVYQLTSEQRILLAQAVKQFSDRFLNGSGQSLTWLNQGVETSRWLEATCEFDNIWLSQAMVAEGQFQARSVARVNNDASEGWVHDDSSSCNFLI